MTKEKYESCIIMARSFINEFISKNELKKKKHGTLFELNKKLGKKVESLFRNREELEKIVTKRAEFVLEKMEKNVLKLSNGKSTEVEANNLAFGLGFVFLLLEHKTLVGSEYMYFKRVSNELFNICEKESSTLAIHNANKLIHLFDEDTKGE